MTSFSDAELPGFFQDADRASLSGQRTMLACTRVRLVGALVAAIGGALSWVVGRFDVWACVAVVGFAAALGAEIVLALQQPERDWYAGRALAESAKTLAWRYAVGGDPFPAGMTPAEARAIMQGRLQVVADKGKDRIALESDDPVVTPKMLELRELSFGDRKQLYLQYRIREQRSWYAKKAVFNKKRAMGWRLALIAGEVLAVVLSGGRAFGVWEVDVSGILAAVVAGGAAWIGVKQYSSLASAYSVAATELSMTQDRLGTVGEQDWPQAVADAEEAISREHTMWIASRSST